MKRHLLFYATANDPGGYVLDHVNATRLAACSPGVDRVEVVIAVSAAQAHDRTDAAWYAALAAILARNPRFRVHAPLFKANTGRDFSSWFAALERFAELDDAAVFLLNRSALGPLEDDWYARYLAHFQRYPETGLCGSSINFEYRREVAGGGYTHVQTYAFLSTLGILRSLGPAFPGLAARSREEAIRDGELALSRRLLEAGYGLSCLWWPDHFFTLDHPHEQGLPQTNPMSSVQGIPFRHWECSAVRRARIAPGPRLARLRSVVDSRWRDPC